MAQKKRSGLQIILVIVFSVLFGVVALAVVMKAANNTSELRSRASELTREYGRWDFSGSEEGWVPQNLTKFEARNGLLALTIGNGLNAIIKPFLSISLPSGNKYVGLRFSVVSKDSPVLGDSIEGNSGSMEGSDGSVGPARRDTIEWGTTPNTTPACQPKPVCLPGRPCPLNYPAGGWCPPTATPSPKSFVFHVFYWLEGENPNNAPRSRPLIVSGNVNGVMNKYSDIRFPETGALTITQLKIKFISGVEVGDKIRFDWITIFGPKMNPSATPSCRLVPPCLPGRACPMYYPRDGWCQSSLSPTPSCRLLPPCKFGETCPMYNPRDGWCPK